MSWLLRALGLLLIATALVIAMSRAPDLPATALAGRWAPAPSSFIDLHGQLVHLRDEGPRGDPLPIVLVHGTSASLHTWEGWVKGLRTQRRVITFDLPAFGLTGPFTGRYAQRPYHGDEYARFVLDLLDHLGVQRAVLGGNSLGGEVAWRVAAMAPERVDRLVLVDAVGPAFTPQSVPLGFLVASTPGLRWMTEYLLPRELVAASVRGVYADPTRVTDDVIERYYQLTLREGNRAALVQRLKVMKNGEHVERLQTLRQPTLVLWGEQDRLIPVSVAHEFQRRIAGSQLDVLPNLGHVPQEEDPQRSLAPVKAFLGLR